MATESSDTDDEPELTEYIKTAIHNALDTYGVGVNTAWDSGYQAIEAERRIDSDGSEIHEFEVLVDMVWRLDLKEVMEEQGLLIWCRDGVEIEVRGFEHDSLLLDVIYRPDHNE